MSAPCSPPPSSRCGPRSPTSSSRPSGWSSSRATSAASARRSPTSPRRWSCSRCSWSCSRSSLVAGALAVAPDRRQAVVELGVGASVAGVLLVVAYSVARSIAVGHVDGPDEQAAARAVWHAFLGDLRTAAWILAISGAAVAAAAASLIKPAQFGEPLRVAANWVSREPRRPALRVLRAAAFVAAGIAVLVERDAVLSLLLTVLGIYLIYEGAERGAPARVPPGGARGGGARAAAREGHQAAPACHRAGPGRADRCRGRALPRQRRHHDGRARRRDPATAAWSCASAGSTASRWRPPTTRCPCRSRAGTRPSRSGRSSTS